MEESLIMRKLERVDKELHSVIDELKREKPKTTLAELRKIMKRSVKMDVDTTKLIRQMREKEYDL